jgi:hypothetical protein
MIGTFYFLYGAFFPFILLLLFFFRWFARFLFLAHFIIYLHILSILGNFFGILLDFKLFTD